jgi:ABC-2 type transport system permease protein
MRTVIKTLLIASLKDRISLGYALIFPIGLLIGLGIAFPEPAYRQQLLGSMLVLSNLFFAIGTAHEVLSQRSQGVYKLLRVTPFSTASFVVSLVAARTVVTLLTSAVVLVSGLVVFGLSVPVGGLLLTLPVQVTGLSNLITFPMLFCSEAFYSLSGAPTWVQVTAKVLPMSYLIDATHAALAGDAGAILLPCLVVIAAALLSAALAIITFRWDPEVHRSRA